MSMNNLKYKALALDLDGTLTDSHKNIPPKKQSGRTEGNGLGCKNYFDIRAAGNGYCRPCKRVGV